jgi:predicted CoA-binding protein
MVEEFIQCRRIAVVGVSRDPKKFGNAIHKELIARGCRVYGVNPNVKEINGHPCYPDLSALRGEIDGVVICVQPEKASEVLRDAARTGIQNIWLQAGSESAEVLNTAKDLGITPVKGKCILMYMPPVQSFHKFHRFFNRLFGKL